MKRIWLSLMIILCGNVFAQPAPQPNVVIKIEHQGSFLGYADPNTCNGTTVICTMTGGFLIMNFSTSTPNFNVIDDSGTLVVDDSGNQIQG